MHVAATLEDAALAAVALARGRTPRAVELTPPAAEIESLVARRWRRSRRASASCAACTRAARWRGRRWPCCARACPGSPPAVRGDGPGHRVVDLGDDAFTLGRPHPMIDGAVRREWIEREAADPATAVVLLDVVLGYGAHPDPAGELVPALEAARRQATAAGRGLVVIASVTGTEQDPQVRSRQVATLRRAGVCVMDSNAQAARLAALVAARVSVGRP